MTEASHAARRRDLPRLFAPEEMALRASPRSRLLSMARRPSRAPSRRERRAEEDRRTMLRLRRWGRELADAFGLHFAALDPERDGVNEHYGVCYSDGEIRIRLRHATTGKLLKESSLVDTLCHELAHLRHMNHGLAFRRLYRRILDAARAQGYYRPGPPPETGRRQLSLFASTDGQSGTDALES